MKEKKRSRISNFSLKNINLATLDHILTWLIAEWWLLSLDRASVLNIVPPAHLHQLHILPWHWS